MEFIAGALVASYFAGVGWFLMDGWPSIGEAVTIAFWPLALLVAPLYRYAYKRRHYQRLHAVGNWYTPNGHDAGWCHKPFVCKTHNISKLDIPKLPTYRA